MEDKFIFYAPLKRIAFIGNKALKKAMEEIRLGKHINENEAIQSLQKIGLFEPDSIPPFTKTKDIPFSPSICILMLTTACNMACTYCYAENGRNETLVMDWDIAKKGIDTAYQNAVKCSKQQFSLSFHGGGEPTLPQDLILKCCKYARTLNPICPISITSNCVWDDSFRDELLSYVNDVSVSFDGAEMTQNIQRPMKSGKGSFEMAFKSIREIEKRNIDYGIRMTVTQQSLPVLLENIQFIAQNTKCKTVQVEAVYNQGKAIGSGQCISDSDLFIEKFLEAFDFAKSKDLQLKVSSVRPNSLTTSFCRAISEALIVTADGQLTSCYEVFDESHPLSKDFLIGNLDQKDGINLHPNVRTQLLEKVEDNRQSCAECFCFYHCAGDCPPKSLLAKENGESFRCRVTKGLTKAMIVDKLIEGNGFWNGNQNLKIAINEICH